MGVQKERNSTFLTAFEQWEKEARSLFALYGAYTPHTEKNLHCNVSQLCFV